MARKSTFYLMFMLLGLVLLGLLVYAGITSQHVYESGDNSTQDLNEEATDASIEQAKPVAIGIGGLVMVFGAVFCLAGVGLFIKIITGKNRGRDL